MVKRGNIATAVSFLPVAIYFLSIHFCLCAKVTKAFSRRKQCKMKIIQCIIFRFFFFLTEDCDIWESFLKNDGSCLCVLITSLLARNPVSFTIPFLCVIVFIDGLFRMSHMYTFVFLFSNCVYSFFAFVSRSLRWRFSLTGSF